MSSSYRVVKLLKNRLYPTYQLHAFMASDRTSPRDGLRLAALTTVHWLKSRLGDAAPSEWNAIPAPGDYLTATDECLPSLYANQGHVINIVSLPEKGMWTLQITEPDLGSDPGNPAQKRQAVPGRIIETNIAFQISGNRVECGFQTVISDPVGTEPEAEVYRTAVVKLLMENPAFGLKQVTELPRHPLRLSTAAHVKKMLWETNDPENQLPAVIFTQTEDEKRSLPPLPAPDDFIFRPAFLPGMEQKDPTPPVKHPLPAAVRPAYAPFTDPPYDLEEFCYSTFSYCRTYVLERPADEVFTSRTGVRHRPGDVLILTPASGGGGSRVIPYRPSRDGKETLRSLREEIKNSLRAREIDFGNITFLSGAREHLLRHSAELTESAEAAGARFQAELEQLNAFWKNEVRERGQAVDALRDQLRRQKEYASRLEEEKSSLREEISAKEDALRTETAKREAVVGFWKRRYDQPKDYEGIEAWVREHFSDRLYLHPRAVSRMLTRSCQCAAVDLVCDALDYLATDWWEMRYLQLPREAALTRCAEKYGRPFDVAPIGQMTIGFTPGEYKIRYGKNAVGKACERGLDFHLRVGNDSENLLRIYFLHDDEKKLIIVGSLPDHLKSVSIQ